MRRIKPVLVSLALCVLSVTLNPGMSLSVPLTLSFGDGSKYWPNWVNTDNDSWPGKDNDLDTIGDPNFTGGTVEINRDWYLTQITFSFASWGNTNNGWNKLEPGDLFLSVDNDTNWEYVVYADNNTNKLDGKIPSSWDYNLYAVDIVLNNQNAYQMSGTDKTGYWSGYLIRDNHPIGLASQPTSQTSSYLGDVNFTGWGTESLTFIFPANTILLNSDILTIGFTVNCANDVIYETLRFDPPGGGPPQQVVPEPASMLLMGSGLVGLAGFLRARKKGNGKETAPKS